MDDVDLDTVLAELHALLAEEGRPVATAPELADRLDRNRRQVYNDLRTLERGDDVATHQVGARGRVWWPVDAVTITPPGTGDIAQSGLSDSDTTQANPASGGDDRQANPGGERRETPVQSGESASKQTDAPPEEIPVARDDVDTDLEVAYREFLQDRPPKKRHGKEIVVDALLLLREHEYLETGDLQEQLYAEHGEHYSTERTLFNAVSRYLRDLPGFEKPDDYGGWAYTSDDEVWAAVREEADG